MQNTRFKLADLKADLAWLGFYRSMLRQLVNVR